MRRCWRGQVVGVGTVSSLVLMFMRAFVIAVGEDTLQSGTIFVTLGDRGVFFAAGVATTIAVATWAVVRATACVGGFIVAAVFIVVVTFFGCLSCGWCVSRSTIGAGALVAIR